MEMGERGCEGMERIDKRQGNNRWFCVEGQKVCWYACGDKETRSVPTHNGDTKSAMIFVRWFYTKK